MSTKKKSARKSAPGKRSRRKRKSKEPKPPKPRESGRIGRPPAGVADWAPAFLAGIRQGLHVRDACAAANVDSTMPYRRRDEDEVFRSAFDEALEIGTRLLEAEAARRAFHGTVKPVYHQGVKVGEVRDYSDVMMMFLLRARKPKKYRENVKHEVSGADGAPMAMTVGVYLPSNGRDHLHAANPDHQSEGKEANAGDAATS